MLRFPACTGLLYLVPLAAAAAPVTIPCGGLVIEADQVSGRISALSVGGQSVLDPAGVPLSGFAIWDYSQGQGWVAVPTIISKDGDRWRLAGELDGIRLQALLTPAGSGYTVSATLERLAGPDRFLSVRFGLPVDVTGWRWWRTLARSFAMRPGRDRRGGFRSGLGQGYADILPFAAASGPGVTVGFAVPMNRQLLHSVSYDGTTRTLGITFDFALCDAVAPFARRVDFDFELFAPPDASGLRAIVAEYFALHPEWGETPCPPGGWCAWGDLAQHEEPLCDFGLLYHEGPSPAGARTCNALGVRNLPYIEPSMYQQYHGDMNRAPTIEEAWQRLRYNASAPLTEVIAARPDESHRLWVQAISAAIATNPIRDSDGEPIRPLPGNWPWIGGTNYGAQFPLNLCPGVPGGVGQERLQEVERALAQPGVDGHYLDSYSVWMTVRDYSTQNLSASRFPPSFNEQLRPATLIALPAMEWVEEVRKRLGPTQQCILPNCFDLNAPFPWHQFDVLGKEYWVPPTGEMMAQFRAVGFHKVVTQLPSYGKDPDRHWFKRMLLYDVFPGGYANTGAETPRQLRAIYRHLIPALRLLHRLQWQPRTGATCDQPQVLVERYGAGPGPVAFVVVNEGPPARITLDVDARAVGLPVGAACLDPLGESTFEWEWNDQELRVATLLATGETALCVIADREGQARLWELWAQDRLEDAAFCMREYALRTGQQHPLADRALALPWSATPDTVAALDTFAAELTPERPLLVRAKELVQDAADRIRRHVEGPPITSQPLPPLESLLLSETPAPNLATLPWSEEFDAEPDPETWKLVPRSGLCEVRDGRLWMELRSATGVAAECLKAFDLTGGPLRIEARVQYSHAGGWWYLGNFIDVRMGNDHILIRVDNASQIRLENNWTAASGYTQPICDYQPIAPNVPHVITLDVDQVRYRLFVDDQLLSEGEHEVEPVPWITLEFSMGSGHQGHGDVAWVDYVRVSRLEGW